MVGCLQSEPKASQETAVSEQSKQVSSSMDKPYLLNEHGEVISAIPPEILSAMKENLRSQAQLDALSTLESLYDPVTGHLKDADRLPEIQFQADQISQALSKGAANDWRKWHFVFYTSLTGTNVTAWADWGQPTVPAPVVKDGKTYDNCAHTHMSYGVWLQYGYYSGGFPKTGNIWTAMILGATAVSHGSFDCSTHGCINKPWIGAYAIGY